MVFNAKNVIYWVLPRSATHLLLIIHLVKKGGCYYQCQAHWYRFYYQCGPNSNILLSVEGKCLWYSMSICLWNPDLVVLQFNTSYSTIVEFARLFSWLSVHIEHYSRINCVKLQEYGRLKHAVYRTMLVWRPLNRIWNTIDRYFPSTDNRIFMSLDHTDNRICVIAPCTDNSFFRKVVCSQLFP